MKKRKMTALFLLGILAAGSILPVQAERSGGLSGELEALPVYQIPNGCSARWEKEDGGEPHTLYLPKKDGISYQYEESRKTGEDDGGIELTYQYGETVRIPFVEEEGKQEGRPCLEGETCCLLSGEKTALTATMPDEDIEVKFLSEKEMQSLRFTEAVDSQGDRVIHVTGKEPGNDYVNAYDSAGNKLATMKFWVENRTTGEKMFAFCLEPKDYTPKSGEWYIRVQKLETTGIEKEKLEMMKKILYYGYGGSGNIFEDDAVGLVTTHLALAHFYTGGTTGHRLYEPFLKQLEALEMPWKEASLSGNNLTGRLNDRGELETETVTLEAFGRNQFYFDLPEQVTIHLTTGEQQTGGRCMLYGGQSFYFTAPAGYEEPFQALDIKGTYQEPVMYLVTPRYETRQSLLGVEWEETSGTISFDVTWENPKGEIEIEKTDEEGSPLQGARFVLEKRETDAEGADFQMSLTTDGTGKGCFTGLEPGEYVVKEEKPPAGYRRKEERREVTLKAGEKEKLVFVNMENEIVLKKQSEKGEPLEGAVFQVWKGEEEKKTYTSDEKGEIRLVRLEPGTYQYQEMTAPEGYIRDPQIYTFTVGEDGRPEDLSYETGHVIFNMPTRTEILKVDGCTGEALEGAVLTLKDHSGKIIKTWTSAKEPQVLEGLVPGEYVLEETEAPEGYTRAKPVKFTVEEEKEPQKIVMEDYPYGEITVSKAIRAEDIIWAHGNPTFFFTLKGNTLEGEEHWQHGYVEFTREEIENCTDSRGMAHLSYTFTRIPPGKAYLITEEAVKDYRLIDVSGSSEVVIREESAQVDLTKDPTGQTVLFVNEKYRWDGFKHNNLKVNQFSWK